MSEHLTDAEGEAWDALNEDADIICCCDGCNYYSPTYDESKECSLVAHFKAILAARVQALRESIAQDIEKQLLCGPKCDECDDVRDAARIACPIEANHEHGVWCGSNWVTTVKRAEKAEADLRVLREAIKGLADTWDHDPDEYHVGLVQASMVAGIRALLGESS